MVEELLKSAAEMKYFDRIAAREFKTSSDLSAFGLRNPKRTIQFDGEEKLTVFLGKDAASEERFYVRADLSRDVFLVSDELLKLAFRDPAEFRDRRLTDLSPDQVDRVIVHEVGVKSSFSATLRAGELPGRSMHWLISRRWRVFSKRFWASVSSSSSQMIPGIWVPMASFRVGTILRSMPKAATVTRRFDWQR